jgi:hypothetical protein
VTRSLVTISKCSKELESRTYRLAVFLDVIIILFILLALGPNYATLVLNSSRSFISKYNVSEVVPFVVIFLVKVRVVIQSPLESLSFLSLGK